MTSEPITNTNDLRFNIFKLNTETNEWVLVHENLSHIETIDQYNQYVVVETIPEDQLRCEEVV
jgi:hypothetical protein